MLDYRELTNQIKQTFINSEKYQLDKHVPVFKKDDTYVGDFFSLTMFELDGDNPPIFYHTYSPYDVISRQTSDYAAVFRAGELVFSTEFTPYMRQRTGVMSSLVLQGIGVTELGSKKVVYIGTGNIAQRDIAALKANFPDLKAVSYINTGNEPVEFVREATKLQVEVNRTSLDDIAEFDIIICHTNAKAAVLTSDIKKDIKQGAVITTFASEDCSEVASDFFDTSQATVIIDWEQTTREAVELKTAVEQGLADTAALVSMKTLLEKGVSSNDKHYTIYRSHGTPIQNLAALQLLLKNAPSLND